MAVLGSERRSRPHPILEGEDDDEVNQLCIRRAAGGRRIACRRAKRRARKQRATHYRLAGDVMTIYHTEVPSPLRGRGYGFHLVRGILDEVPAA